MKKSTDHHEYLLTKLKDTELATEYLNAALEDGDISVFLLALQNVVQAQGGISFLAKKTQKSRTSLYKALAKTGNPYLISTNKILSALHMQLTVSYKKPKPMRKTAKQRART